MQQDRPRVTWSGPALVAHGGSREYDPDMAVTGYTFRYLPESKFPSLGFRLVRISIHEGEHNVPDRSP
jgi:hypothetical protein